jgi:urease accessory protein
VARSTELGVGLAIRAERPGARTVVAGLAGTEPWRPRVLPPDRRLARVVLVQSRASLLSGDVVAVRIDLGPGARLEIVELGATIANHVRGGPPASLDVAVSLADGARLVWLAAPLIASAGCALDRRVLVDLAGGARALLGEAIVLGRHGEAPGRVDSRTRITLDGRPLVDEEVATEPAWLLRSPVLAGQARLIETLTLAGIRDDDPPAGAFQAHGPATIWRDLDPPQARDRDHAAITTRWRALLLD